MKRCNIRWLIAAVPLAVACAAVRVWQLNTAFEGAYGLPIPMAPASVILLALLVITAGVFALLGLKQPVNRKIMQYPRLAIYAPGDSVFAVAAVIAALLSLMAAPFLFLDGWKHWTEYQAIKNAAFVDGSVPGGNNGILMLAAAFMSVLAFFGIMLTAKSCARGGRKGRMGILAAVVNGCLWLMELYRGHAAEPVRWSYGPMLVAAVFGILLYLNFAGLLTNIPAPRRTLWLAGMTVVISAVALAGEWDVSSALLSAAQIFLALAVLWRTPNNLAYPPDFSEVEDRAEEKVEEETHE